jgi:hypothetical protein
MRNAHKILLGNHLIDVGVEGGAGRINVNLKEMWLGGGGLNWCLQVRDGDRWRALVDAVMKICVP